MNINNYEAVVVGTSAGGFNALNILLPLLPTDLPLSIIVVQHLHPTSNQFHVVNLNNIGSLQVKEAEDKEELQSRVIYFAAPDYHLLIERDKTFSFSREEKVCFSRPSIDVLFESAAVAYSHKLIGIILTGANADGATGLAKIKKFGGLTIVQSPQSAEVPFMPQAAIDGSEVDYILDLKEIASLLSSNELFNRSPQGVSLPGISL